MKRKCIFIVMLVVFLSLAACQKTQTPTGTTLTQVQDKDDLLRLLSQTSRYYNQDIFMMEATDDATGDTNSGSNTHSKTNVQVDGVDEGDVIKTDGNRIYYLRHNTITVVEVDSEGDMTILLDAQKDSAYAGWYESLYITDDKLVVIGNFYEVEDVNKDGMHEDNIWYYLPYYHTRSTIEIYDIETLTLEDTYELSGTLNTSRLIDDTLYLISNHYTYYNEEEDNDIRPYFYHNDIKTVPDYDEIYYIPDVPAESFTIISTIDLADESTLSYDIFLGTNSWGQVYMNHEDILLAASYYSVTEVLDSNDQTITNYEQKGLLINYHIEDDGSIEFGGSGAYKGRVINQFALDAYDDTFRLVTTAGFGDNAINRLYIFERTIENDDYTLTRIGFIDEGLGKPGETVRSVRFNEDTATVVTFEQTDPFYVIDLSDKNNPVIEGALEIPGFSTYQHPWKDNLIIGIGFEANENGVTIGIKLSLYDISNPQNPVEIGDPLVLLNESNGWQYGEALYNHKAILISNTFNFIGFSIQNASWTSDSYTRSTDYLIFEIDETSQTPIEIAATISHNAYFDQNDINYWYYGYSINRAVTINNHLYVLSNGAITQHDIQDAFTRNDEIVFNN